MKYIYLLIILLNCSDFINKSKKTDDITKIEIRYDGEVDKPLPKMIFCKDCKEYSNFETCTFHLNILFFEKIENCLSSFTEKSRERKENTVLSVSINSQKTNFFLTKKEAKILIQEIMTKSTYKKNNVLDNHLKRYCKMLNK